ncbi:hypothetical protein PhCBS80983_g02660 [Powellomyces hirtus]|uniref:Secreted protein n=1 Tax=Powellomyces hirtus TaxID=109895 RepID=A0A507E529_9FUNG|nr:hypothetical protein DFJ77DRAFT_99185 [Powellomyces hirtus]TPX59173.1 hypothetical protein PhCBS80983_g02660 [Powellomyces hirtus]
MVLFNILLLMSLLACAVYAAPTQAGGPDVNEVYFKSINYGGSGCPISPPTANVILADDKQSFTVIFDQFTARIGPGVSVVETRKNCQLNIQMHIPGGWQYSIASADFRGWAALDKGVTGRQQSIYYFQGDDHTTITQATLRGPAQKNYNLRDQIALESTSWSPCGEDRPMNINTAIFLSSTNPKSSGQLTTDSIDGKVVQKYQFQWKKCKK